MPHIKKITNTVFFGIHILLVPAWFTFCVIASPIWVLVLTALHQLHLRLFRGCSLTWVQKKLGGIAPHTTFFETVWKRVTGRAITKVENSIFKHALWSVPAVSAMIRLVW